MQLLADKRLLVKDSYFIININPLKYSVGLSQG